MSTASKIIKEKQLPAYSVSIKICSGIARFPCDSMALLFSRAFDSGEIHTKQPVCSGQ